MTARIIHLDDPLAIDTGVVGGKAASLAHLRRRDAFDVPPGVVVPTDATPTAAAHAVIEELGSGPFAVRSSAIDEDGTVVANAGRYATVLGATGEAGLATAVADVRASAPEGRPIPVLVMPLLEPVAAGVASSSDPVTGEDRAVVEAVHGLADRLLAGTVDPERWHVSRSGEVTRLGGPPVLSLQQTAVIASLARRVAGDRDAPQEIEWAVTVDGAVPLLQARPVTALPVRPAIEEPPPGETWRRVDEAFGRPLRALEFSVWAPVAEEATARAFEAVGAPLERTSFRRIGGWVYSRIVPLGDAGRDDQPAPGPLTTAVALRLVPSIRRRLRTAAQVWTNDPGPSMIAEWERSGREALRGRTRELREVDRTGLDDRALATHLDDVLAQLGRAWQAHASLPMFSTYLALGRLGVLCERLLGWEPVETLQLVTGHATPPHDRGQATRELATSIAADPQARWLLEQNPDHLRQLDSPAGESLRVFLDEHGHEIVGSDLAHPTWAEDPTPLLALLRAHGDTPNRQGLDPLAVASAAQQRAEHRLAGRQEDLASFRAALAAARDAAPYADDTESEVHQAMAVVRYAAREIGSRLHQRCVIDHPHDVLHLDVDELRAAARTGHADIDVARRRSEHRWALAHRGPQRYGPQPPASDPDLRWAPRSTRDFLAVVQWTARHLEPPTRQPRPDAAAESALHGIAGSAGTATGPVRILRDPNEFPRLRAGDILVCPSANASWSVVLPLVAAIVTEVGGPLAHPAVLARESGIPAVLGVAGATTHLSEGTVVRVDGRTGTIRPAV